MNRNNRERERDDDNFNPWIAGGVAAGIGILAGGAAYWLATRESDTTPSFSSDSNTGSQGTRAHNAHNAGSTRSEPPPTPPSNSGSFLSSMASLTSQFLNMGSEYQSDKVVPNSAVPAHPQLTNLNALLEDIYIRYVQLKSDDFGLYYKVFTSVFTKLHQSMKDVEPYFNRYSSDIKFAGSHFDRLRINKPDEFDMDIVVSLPLNYKQDPFNPGNNDFTLEHKGAGFVQLKMGQQYKNLPLRDGGEWSVNRPAYEWKDDKDYLLRSNFINWFKSVASRALSRHEINGVPTFYVDNVEYTVGRSESGPAFTIIIRNRQGFKLDVDLVPALKFPEDRWPICRGYRNIPSGCNRGSWLLVPKQDKSAPELDQKRMWRIALQEQERALIHNLNNCKKIIRLLKKLRDAQGMYKIASYYVKTLFLWEIVERDDSLFWRKSPGELFTIMVKKFHQAMVNGSIPYFWNKGNNLIGLVNRGILNEYAKKLENLLRVLEDPTQYKRVAFYLLSRDEFSDYNDNFLHI